MNSATDSDSSGVTSSLAPSTCSVEVVHSPTVNYAMEQSGVPIVAAVRVTHRGEAPLTGAVLEISLGPDLGEACTLRLPDLAPGESFEHGTIDLRPPFVRLRGVVESEPAELRYSVVVDGRALVSETRPLRLLAFNEWPGTKAPLELLAVFVTPNQPAVARVLEKARDWLSRNSSEDAIAGYAARSTQRARLEVESIYAALQQLGLSYVGVPASFEEVGQKVRLPDQVLSDSMGNCLDLSLLVAACLEQMGYAPLVILVGSHAFPGVWLIDERFPEGVVADPARLRNQIRLGNLLVFDATTAISGPRPPLPVAIASAIDQLADDASLVGAIDVRVARRARFLPLPIARRDAVEKEPPPSHASPRTVGSSGLASSERAARESTASVEADDPVSRRIRRWKERLLDLTLRNRLLSMRRDRNVIALEVPDLAHFENCLAAADEFEILPYPKLDQGDPRAKELLEKRMDKAAERERLLAELRAKRLHATLGSDELWPVAIKLYRQARSDLEEGGANTLFVVLGILKWFESSDATQPRYAPLLMVPVRMSHEPRQRRIRLRRTEEDIVGNVTLAEKLRRDFALDLSVLAEPMGDDSGIDVESVFTSVRAAIQAMPRFELLEECAVAHFTFGKFLLWRDLEVNAATLLDNPLVRHVAEGGARPWPRGGETQNEAELDVALRPDELPTVVDADSTQLSAVLAATRGETFVLQGPPGTGKSQTITNLIAATLGAGKSVLFVAEKKAALDVVYRRLESVGLGDFCLELHSNKASKRQVLESLGRAFDREAAADNEFATMAANVAASRDRLNAHVRALHSMRAIGRSFFSASARVLELARDGIPLLDLKLPRGLETTSEDLAAALAAARELGFRSERVVPIDAHPWRDSTLSEWSGERESAIRASLVRAGEVGASLERAARVLESRLTASGIDDLSSLHRLTELVAIAIGPGADGLPPATADAAGFESMRSRLDTFIAELSSDEADRAEIARRFRGTLFDLGDELPILRTAFAKHAEAGIVGKVVGLFTMSGPKKRLAPHAIDGIPDSALVVKDLARAEACRARAGKLADARRSWRVELGPAAPTAEADSAAYRSSLDRWNRFVAGVAACASDPRNARLDAVLRIGEIARTGDETSRRTLVDAARNVADAISGLRAAIDEMERIASIVRVDPIPEALPVILAALSERERALPRLREWCGFVKAEVAAKGLDLEPLAAKLRSGAIGPDAVERSVERAWLERFVFLARDADPVLRDFDGAEHSRRVAEFRALDAGHLRAARGHVAAKLDERVPDSSAITTDESEPGILARELKKKARHMPLRKLFARIPNLVFRLKPCFLMSPLSVAQYLTAEGRRFDLVVFDEASQIGTHDSIGSLARGGQAVIVGDSRQLPPTTFFQRAASDDDAPVDEADVEELESVLDEAVAARLPERSLRWHYRSRHDSLIRFSNHHYYEDRLHVFPSAFGHVADLGVKFHAVAGVYEFATTRTNPIEARALVDGLVASLRATAPGTRTFGVVTFSQPQQILVLDLLDEARATYPEIEPHFDSEADEPVFVKNLENVQGDERDEILFSICYGPAQDGKVRMNFGPLNQSGGERRLNVAVTRARKALRVYSSLGFDRIDVLRSSAKGVHHLREFLRYVAEEGASEPPKRGGLAPNSEFERAVGDALRSAGYEVDTNVGCGRTRIDLAVRHPRRAGEYVLGVELDGANYVAAVTARDRDRLRPFVLENLGWRLFRIWSSDWWFDRDREIARLLEAVRLAIAASDDSNARIPPAPSPREPEVAAPNPNRAASTASNEAKVESSEEPSREDEPVESPSFVVPYEHAKLGVIARDPERIHEPSMRPEVERAILDVVAVESPILIDSVVRDVARAFSHKTVRERVRGRIEGILAELVKAGRIVAREDFVWRSDSDPDHHATARGADAAGETRGLDEIAIEEISFVASRILESALSLPIRDLARATARAFQVMRFGKEAESRLLRAIELVVSRGRARRLPATDAMDERIEIAR